MVDMAKEPRKAADEPRKRRNTIFLTLDDATERRLVKFINSQRVKPDRAAVGLVALVEFLDRIEKGG